MKIVIIGWYGTETIGDRAILAGLFNVFSESFDTFEVKLGCLNTLLPERTLNEDGNFYLKCSNQRLHNISLFDSRKQKELDGAISWSDIVLIGGGPLMEIEAMYMLLYAFKKAKKMGKKCVVAGCGMGPFKTSVMVNTAIQIVNHSDATVFRDNNSQEFYIKNTQEKKDTLSLIDPAAIASLFYLDHFHTDGIKDYIAINFREPPMSEYAGLKGLNASFFSDIVKNVANNFCEKIRLVPMHSYAIGGDDRLFLNRVARISKVNNLIVDNRPLSLEGTMKVYHNATFCIGMRFHSVLLQTILNGRNIILDYTDPQNGKIVSFLRQLRIKDSIGDRYVSIVDNKRNLALTNVNTKDTITNLGVVRAMKDRYVKSFKNLC